MGMLAAACVVLGLAAAPVVGAIGVLVPASALPTAGALGIPDAASGRAVLPAIALAVVALVGVAALAPRLLGPVRTRVSETWACGLTLQPIHQYSSTAFAKPIRLMFRGIVRPVREVEIVHRAGTRFVASVRYSAHVAPVFERYVYGSVATGLVLLSRIVRRAQNGSLQTYLAYVLAALLVAVAVAR
jgi:hydrogenase-4 component B